MIEIREESAGALDAYGRIPIAFEVREILDCSAPHDGLGGLAFTARRVAMPWVKDYDRYAGEGPTRWAKRFDIGNWGFLGAFLDGARAGAAVIAHDTPGVDLLEERRDVAVLWDLRVAPGARGRGVGHALFRAAERWCVARGCGVLKVETQNVNVPACRFYLRQGCVLGAVNRFAYPGLPDEVQLLWYKSLASD